MPKIYAYRKITDKFTTHTLFESHQEDEDSARIIELCTIDGVTYVFVPDGILLPEQPEIIASSLKEITLDAELKAKIIEKSPHIQLTNKRMDGRTAVVRYSKQDENQLRSMEMFFEPEELDQQVTNGRAWKIDV